MKNTESKKPSQDLLADDIANRENLNAGKAASLAQTSGDVGAAKQSSADSATEKRAKQKKDKSGFISGKEVRAIAKENARTIKYYEKRKKRKRVPESEYVTQMKDQSNIVEFDNLHTYFFTDSGVVKAVNGVSFSIPQGATVGVVGESGCGKSVTSMSLMQLIQAPQGQIMDGSEIRFKSAVYKEDEKGEKIPVFETDLIGGQETIRQQPKLDKKGNPVLAADGSPAMENVQKLDHNGIPIFEKEEKVYNIARMPVSQMRKIRGREISMIFQEPMTSLNPVFKVGKQIDEIVLLHMPGANKKSAKARTFEMMRLVGIIPEIVYNKYPHELSGGMRQRIIIAMSLACDPKLVIADEPTTALDVTIQAQILELLRDVKDKISGSIMLITHDLGVIAEMADFVVVMYAGKIIETGTVKEIFDNPKHPYTVGLQKSKPAVNKKVDRLYSIPGAVPNPIGMPPHCHFSGRCDKRFGKCSGDYPGFVQISPTHKVACHLYTEGE
jgi:peptide/nickel transport system ATP-binding protein